MEMESTPKRQRVDLTASSGDETEDDDVQEAIRLSLLTEVTARSAPASDARDAPTQPSSGGSDAADAQLRQLREVQALRRQQWATGQKSGVAAHSAARVSPPAVLSAPASSVPRTASSSGASLSLPATVAAPTPPAPTPRTLPRPAAPVAGASPALVTDGSTFYLNRLRGQKVGADERVRTVSLPELIGQGVEAALLTSFVTDVDWAVSQFAPGTPISIVQHYDSRQDKPGHFMLSKNLTVIHPPLLQFGCFHAKLMLLLYAGRLRVVVSSSNLREDDWNEIGQQIWFQDFPKHAPGQPRPPPNEFASTLKSFVHNIGVPSVQFLDAYDFTAAAVSLVCSVAGYHKGEDIAANGHQCLRRCLQRAALPVTDPSDELVFQASSLGNLYSAYQKEFVEACSSGGRPMGSSALRIVFPTRHAVQSSCMIGSNQICLNSKYWQSAEFPRSAMREVVPAHAHRKKALLHSKVIVRLSTTGGEAGRPIWLYVGSHNFSPSAWGRFQKGGTQLHVANYELGVLLVNRSEDAPPDWLSQLPFLLPAPAYKPGDVAWNNDMN